MSPPEVTEPPRRSTRLRPKPAVIDADPGADAELERGGKRRRKAAGKAHTSGAAKEKTKSKPKKAKRQAGAAAGAIDDDDDVCADEPDAKELRLAEEEELAALEAEGQDEAEAPAPRRKKRVARARSTKREADADSEPEERFVGDPIPDDEARRRWPKRYTTKPKDPDDTQKVTKGKGKADAKEEEMSALRHYTSALVDGAKLDLGDDVYVKAGRDEENFIGRITEFFEGIDHGSYFSCRWFFRVSDTVISKRVLEVDDHDHHPKRVFLSEENDDNLIESIISKVNIIHVGQNITPQEKEQLISKYDLYYDMSYSVPFSAFANMPTENYGATSSEAAPDAQMATATLLDLYSGCGAMSTGLCLGAKLSGLKLSTKWAVDMNKFACDSLKHNHPYTLVRNMKAEDFLSLLLHWDALCAEHGVHNSNSISMASSDGEYDENEHLPKGIFEVEKLVDICYGDPNKTGEAGLCFKVRWKSYDASHDTWEPIDGLRDCPERIREFVENGYRESILPLPGRVDVICGGPPCQGISGLNRFRKKKEPLADERNKQLIVFMDIVKFLRPKYVLMENVVDILKFADGFLGRYALSRLVSMSYQARLGMMTAGCYGLPQFRMRAFLWGALPSVVLPKFPLPTHDVVNRGQVPTAFSQCLVAYDKGEVKHLETALVLRDALSDLRKVGNNQPNDVMKYGIRPKTKFQRYIRLNRKDMEDNTFGDAAPKNGQLFDHRPLKLNNDDYERVRQIPRKKGANFRNLKGVRVGKDNTVEFDPDIPRVYLPSGKHLVPNYCMTYVKGKSPKPFGRLWWDETVGTVVTRAEPHNQIILHPTQDRVLTIRENARLQGFPDYYKLFGPIKQRYIQVGNAVAVPVARALGYALGQAYRQGEFNGDEAPLFKLPGNFIPTVQSTAARRSSVGASGVEEVVQEEENFDQLLIKILCLRE